MRTVLIGLSAVSLTFLGTDMNISACGDKLLVLGRGVRSQMFRTTQNPASILIYAKSQPHQSSVRDSNLPAVLKRAGHKVWSVAETSELRDALQSRQYDLIVGDLADAAMLEQQLRSLSSPLPLIVPLVDKRMSAQVSPSTNPYSHILKTPDKDSRYLATIDQAMKLRSKQGQNRRLKGE